MRADRWLVWLLDEALDRLPYIHRPTETGRMSVCRGGYGCLLRLHRYWDASSREPKRHLLRDVDVILPKFDGTWERRTESQKAALHGLLADTQARLNEEGSHNAP